jgi:hypothetical protein
MSHDKRKYDGFTLEEKVDEALSILATITNAFPDGPEAHRAAHVAMIKAAAAQEKFWEELKFDLAKKGILAILAILAGLVVAGLAVKMGAMAAFAGLAK